MTNKSRNRSINQKDQFNPFSLLTLLKYRKFNQNYQIVPSFKFGKISHTQSEISIFSFFIVELSKKSTDSTKINQKNQLAPGSFFGWIKKHRFNQNHSKKSTCSFFVVQSSKKPAKDRRFNQNHSKKSICSCFILQSSKRTHITAKKRGILNRSFKKLICSCFIA